MAKRAKKRGAKSAVRKRAKRSIARAAAPRRAVRPSFLGVIRGAITHQAARPILGRLSSDDLDVLAKHMSEGTLMSGLTPLADTVSRDDAVKVMPADIGNVIAKLPESDVTTLRDHLNRLGRGKNEELVCNC
jgi:hypothetical protein